MNFAKATLAEVFFFGGAEETEVKKLFSSWNLRQRQSVLAMVRPRVTSSVRHFECPSPRMSVNRFIYSCV